jgi:hypothetical protein
MLYHLGGMDYRDDPYLAFVESPNERPIAKLLLTCSLNTGSEERAIEAARNELDRAKAYHERHPDQPDRLILPEGKSLRGLMDRMRAVHRPILSRLFVPRTGVELQRLDSEIACDILEHCTACGIVCLPIHDSFLVPRRHATELREAMEFFYQERLGHAPVCH